MRHPAMIRYKLIRHRPSLGMFIFFSETAPTRIYTLSLHDALPIWPLDRRHAERSAAVARERASFICAGRTADQNIAIPDRKSTRLNSSHSSISYAVFCLKKKNDILMHNETRHPT